MDSIGQKFFKCDLLVESKIGGDISDTKPSFAKHGLNPELVELEACWQCKGDTLHAFHHAKSHLKSQ